MPNKRPTVVELKLPLLAPMPQCEMPLEEMHPASNFEARERVINRERRKRTKNRNLDPLRCAHTQKYEINGRRLCSRHAGMEAIRILLGDNPNRP